MKAFIEISKAYRKKWSSMPFVLTMCKELVREDVQNLIYKYIEFKKLNA